MEGRPKTLDVPLPQGWERDPTRNERAPDGEAWTVGTVAAGDWAVPVVANREAVVVVFDEPYEGTGSRRCCLRLSDENWCAPALLPEIVLVPVRRGGVYVNPVVRIVGGS